MFRTLSDHRTEFQIICHSDLISSHHTCSVHRVLTLFLIGAWSKFFPKFFTWYEENRLFNTLCWWLTLRIFHVDDSFGRRLTTFRRLTNLKQKKLLRNTSNVSKIYFFFHNRHLNNGSYTEAAIVWQFRLNINFKNSFRAIWPFRQ